MDLNRVTMYDVDGVPDLRIDISDLGHVSLVIGLESATMTDAAQITALQQKLEQAMVDQRRIQEDRFLPGLGDYVQFRENDEHPEQTGYVTRGPWGSRARMVSIRTDEEPSRIFTRLVPEVKILVKRSRKEP